MRPREGGNEGEAIDTYDQWLAWEHGLKLRRTKAANARATVAPADLDWGEQMLIDASVQVVAPAASELVVYFYERLFAENPRLRALFPRDMTEQRERLLTALLTIVQDAE